MVQEMTALLRLNANILESLINIANGHGTHLSVPLKGASLYG